MKAHNECGYIKLYYAIVEQAVSDIRTLQSNGLIVNGKPITPWPRTRFEDDKSCGYSKVCQVNELLDFFRCGHADRLLAGVGCKISSSAICRELGI